MIEWDLDAYRRKFLDCITVFSTEAGKKTYGHVCDMSPLDKGARFKLTGVGWLPEEYTPVYHRFISKYYTTKDGNTIYAVRRRIKKSFKVGLHTDNYIMTNMAGDAGYDKIDPLGTIKIDVEKALKKAGPISETLFITEGSVMLLDKNVGLRKGSKFFVQESVKQEVSDCLQGFKCTISA